MDAHKAMGASCSFCPALGVGTSRLARPPTTLLPDLTLEEALEPTRIPGVAGMTSRQPACVTTRPSRAPPHTMADVGVLDYAGVLA
jgi:magnesium chelatase family protein